MKLLGISGALAGAKTAVLVNKVLEKAKEHHPALDVELVNLGDYSLDFADGRPFEAYNDDTRKVINTIKDADIFVIGSPVYQASITGALKNVFDLLPQDIFDSKIVGLVMNGGTERHYLVMENQLRPIVSFLKAYIPAKNLFVSSSSFDAQNEINDEDIKARINSLAEELISLHLKINGSN
ncbi:NADPH-dependent FMN reductase [Bacillus sp. T33-2]|uniref:NADPH-dependent FMN reductase n=1 Tax=Bacillus sp. T33-2 TaxID=2054168 RepID=UPI000C76767B|nr:NADPH-dependent FMN reductase [Bacillus sp. T33-2]PLR91152.1 NADH-dependent FMN reductase [Bacillus sp. T33-2]